MEVHHHPDVEKKGFKEYVLEGLMIFLAVMMGFIAENVRETISDHEHVKQLTSELVHDIKTDTSTLHEIDSAESLILKRSDSLSVILEQPIQKADMKNMQRLIINVYSQWPFYASTGAISAIKTELRLKQFSGSNIGGLISAYEGRTNILNKIEEVHSQLLASYIQTFMRLHFTPANLNAALNGGGAVVNSEMRDLTQNDLTQLAADLALIKEMNRGLISYNRRLKSKGIELIDYVKKQYGVDE